MRIHKIAVIAAFALASVPAAALAAHPATPANSNANSKANATSTTGTSSKAEPNSHASAAKVMFILRGALTAYTAAAGTTNGSVSITVASSNRKASSLKGATLTFPVSSSTKIAGTVTPGDKGVVKVRAAKNTSAATLQTLTAFQVIDQGASASSSS
jgi:hypothetical protein